MRLPFVALLLLLSPFPGAFAAATDRSTFLTAEQALNRDNPGLYYSLKPALEEYPLYPYLLYKELLQRLDTTSSHEVEEFLQRYPDSGPAYLLRGRWLDRLAAEGRWQEVVKFYAEGDDRIRLGCHYLTALIHSGHSDLAMAQTEQLWLHGASRPDACDAVFENWRKQGMLTPELVWRRIALAMENGETGLAGHLGNYLAGDDKKWLNRWLAMRNNPRAGLLSLSGNHPYRDSIIAYGLRRLGNSNPEAALDTWRQLQKKFEFTAAGRCLIEQDLGRALEIAPGDQVYTFFLDSGDCIEQHYLQASRLRAALLRQDWPQLLKWLGKMPPELQEQQQWQYWKARALEQQHGPQSAAALYREVADDRSIYAYLASDRLSIPYKYAHQATPVDDALRRQLLADAALRRLRELHELGRDVEVRREWQLLMKRLDRPQKQAAAVLFHEWGIADRAIFTLAESEFWEDMELRFPLQHRDLIEKFAAQRGIDPSWLFAVLRQESAFMRRVESSAGAQGLMQLLPATARQVARHYGIPPPGAAELGEPLRNIELGSGYLAMMLEKFDGNLAFATAAYNAGPARVQRWRDGKPLPADIWIELIPFGETRDYVKRVMTYATIYDSRRGDKGQTISDRIGLTVPAKSAQSNLYITAKTI
jgi:soluble lytic murein transglycosylase